MEFTKTVLADLEMVYAVSSLQISGETHLAAATEGYGKCLLFTPPSWKESTIWDGPGGTMNIVPLGDDKGSFLAIQKFFPVFKSEEACIVYAEPGEVVSEPWKVKKKINLPFVHRIEQITVGKTQLLVASTLCGGKDYQDDWSQAGAVYACVIPKDADTAWSLHTVLSGVSKNHGMHVTTLDNEKVVTVAGAEGVFVLHPPPELGDEWDSERIISREVSDLWLFDIDSDGDDEIITIEPFHGDHIVIYKQVKGKWEPVHEESTQFGHVIWGGKILNRSCLLIGGRAGRKELSILYQKNRDSHYMRRDIIDEKVGPASAVVVRRKGKELICSANHGSGQVALYSPHLHKE